MGASGRRDSLREDGMSVVTRLLGKPAERTPLARKLISAGTRVGVTPYNWRLLKSTRHAQLHLQARSVSPPPYEARAAHPVSDEDVALCERLIAAYGKALGGRAGEEQVDGMWSWIYETRQRQLAEILDERDARALALELGVDVSQHVRARHGARRADRPQPFGDRRAHLAHQGGRWVDLARRGAGDRPRPGRRAGSGDERARRWPARARREDRGRRSATRSTSPTSARRTAC